MFFLDYMLPEVSNFLGFYLLPWFSIHLLIPKCCQLCGSLSTDTVFYRSHVYGAKYRAVILDCVYFFWDFLCLCIVWSPLVSGAHIFLSFGFILKHILRNF